MGVPTKTKNHSCPKKDINLKPFHRNSLQNNWMSFYYVIPAYLPVMTLKIHFQSFIQNFTKALDSFVVLSEILNLIESSQIMSVLKKKQTWISLRLTPPPSVKSAVLNWFWDHDDGTEQYLLSLNKPRALGLM